MSPMKICIVVTTLWLISISSSGSAERVREDGNSSSTGGAKNKEGSSDGGNGCLNCSSCLYPCHTTPPSPSSIYPVYGAPPPPAGPAQANCPPSVPVVQCCGQQQPGTQNPPIYGYPPPYYNSASSPTNSRCLFGGLFFMNSLCCSILMLLLVFQVY